MRQRKIYDLLSFFDDEELSEFHSFLASPFLNNNKTLIRFFHLWRDRVLDAPDEKELTVEEFLAGSQIQPYRIDKLCSQLYAQARDFMIRKEFDERPLLQDELFLHGLARYGPNSAEYKRHFRKTSKKMDKLPESSDKHRLQMQTIWLDTERKIRNRDVHTHFPTSLSELNFHLDEYYLLLKLKLYCASSNLNKMLNQETPDGGELFHGLLPEFEKKNLLSPLARSYWLAAKMIRGEKGEESYFQLAKILREDSGTFETQESRELHNYALNYCIRKRNKGQEEFSVHIGNMYKLLLKNGLLFEQGRLLPAQMKNLVVFHSQIGELEWVRGFIRDFSKYLPEASVAPMQLYNAGVLAFNEGNYPLAIESFQKAIHIPMEDDFYGLGVRMYLWRSYFEHFDQLLPEEVDAMFRLYDSFRVYIDRNDRISQARKQKYRNFIREFKRFLVILNKPRIQLEDLQNLEQDLQSISLIAKRSWFLQKVQEKLSELDK